MNCETKSRDGFCLACDTIIDIKYYFREFLLNPIDFPPKTVHHISTNHAEAIRIAWQRISQHYGHPCIGIVKYRTWIGSLEVVA